MLAHVYNIITYCSVGAPGHARKFVEGLNATDRRFLSKLMTLVQLNGASGYYKQMAIHISTVNKDISLARELQKHLLEPSRKNVVIVQGKYRKRAIQLKWDVSEYYVQDKNMCHIHQ